MKKENSAMYSLASLILKLPVIDNIIYGLIISDRHYKIADEDLEAIKSYAFKNYC